MKVKCILKSNNLCLIIRKCENKSLKIYLFVFLCWFYYGNKFVDNCEEKVFVFV